MYSKQIRIRSGGGGGGGEKRRKERKRRRREKSPNKVNVVTKACAKRNEKIKKSNDQKWNK